LPQAIHKQCRLTRLSWMLWCAALFTCGSSLSTADDSQTSRISIIIDDMGSQQDAGIDALQLPGAVTYAFLPHTPHSQSQAKAAYHLGKEIMLHLPMQAISSNQLLGPGSLTLNMDRKQFGEIFRSDLASVPYVAGINNHMGSLLTRHPGHMQWLMEEIKQQHNLYFIDSRTTRYTVASQLANELQVPSRQRDVFLDNDPSPAAITHQFERLIFKAKKQGGAIGIGHPHPTTIRILRQLLPRLKQQNIELVPVSQLVFRQSKTRLVEEEPIRPPSSTLVMNKHPFQLHVQ